jgi:hypothetical protein
MRLGIGATDCREVDPKTFCEPALRWQSITCGDIASLDRHLDRIRDLEITRLAVRAEFREPFQHFTQIQKDNCFALYGLRSRYSSRKNMNSIGSLFVQSKGFLRQKLGNSHLHYAKLRFIKK